MFNDLAASIEKWFEDQEDEFFKLGTDLPSCQYGNVETASCLVYTTKFHATTKIIHQILGRDVAILGRPGLPCLADLRAWMAPSRRLLFLGDADPPDLLIFAWLRRHVAIEFLGVKDRFLQNYFTGSLDRISITLSESELESRGFLAEMMPDYSTLLGDYCSQLLAEGFKIELEGATLSIKTPRGNLNSDV